MLVHGTGRLAHPPATRTCGAVVEVRWTGVACIAVIALAGCSGPAPTQGEPRPTLVVASATPVVPLPPTPSGPSSPAASPTLSEQQLLERALASPDHSYPPFITSLPPIPPGGRRTETAPTELSGEGPDDTGIDVGAGSWRVTWHATFPAPGHVVVPTCEFEITVFDAAGDVAGSAFVTIAVDEDAGTSFVIPVTRRQTLTVLVGGDCAWQWSVYAQ